MSRLTCTQAEAMLLDAADGVLLPEDETHFRLHLADCTACERMYAEIQKGSAWMDMLKEESPVPPEGLVDRIVFRTSGNEGLRSALVAQVAHNASLFGGSTGAKVIPFRPAEPKTAWARMAHTVMQPRFAMTAAMAFFSIALTLNLFGVHISSLRASDLKPTSLRRGFWNANNSVVRYYDNLRVVYELESRVHEMQRDADTQRSTEPDKKDDEQQRPAPTGQPRSSSPFPGQHVQSQLKFVVHHISADKVHGEGEQA